MAKAPAGTLYRGREGMWSWVAHRITGVLIFFFLLVHVLDTALVRVSPEAYNAVIGHRFTVAAGPDAALRSPDRHPVSVSDCGSFPSRMPWRGTFRPSVGGSATSVTQSSTDYVTPGHLRQDARLARYYS